MKLVSWVPAACKEIKVQINIGLVHVLHVVPTFGVVVLKTVGAAEKHSLKYVVILIALSELQVGPEGLCRS